MIPYKYTKSNYYGILMNLAWESFDQVKDYSNKLSKWSNYNDADLDIKVERIKLYRDALDLYESDSEISPDYIAQISINLGNLYHEMDRIVESIEVLSETVTDTNGFPMALGNYAIKCYSLVSYSVDDNANKYLLNLSLKVLDYMLENIDKVHIIV